MAGGTGRTACALVCGCLYAVGCGPAAAACCFGGAGIPGRRARPGSQRQRTAKPGTQPPGATQGRPRCPLRTRGIFPIWRRPFPMQSGDLPALRRRPAPLFRSLRRRRVYSASGGFSPADGSLCSPSGSSGIWAKKSSTRRRMESSIRGTPIFSSISPKKRNLFFICSRVAG